MSKISMTYFGRLFVVIAMGAMPLTARATSWSISNVPSYFSGDFNSPVRTDIFYDPTTIQAQGNGWGLDLTIPYIAISNLPNGATYDSSMVLNGGKGIQTHDASGMGDVLLAANYLAYQGTGFTPSVSPYALIKFGTASSSAGLGTGLNDYEIGSNFSENLGWVHPYVTLGYDFVGHDTAFPLRNVVTYSAGTTVDLFLPGTTASTDSLALVYSGSQSELASYPGIGTVTLAWNHTLTPAGTGIQLYVLKGVTASSPDVGAGCGLHISF